MTEVGVSIGSSLTDTRWHRPVTSVDFAILCEQATMLQPKSVLITVRHHPVMTWHGAKALEQS